MSRAIKDGWHTILGMDVFVDVVFGITVPFTPIVLPKMGVWILSAALLLMLSEPECVAVLLK